MHGGMLIMGTALPPNEPGTNCALCFGTPASLGLVTPKFITVNFAGVLPGASFLDTHVIPSGNYRLQQVANCLWRLTIPGVANVEAGFGLARTRIAFDQGGSGSPTWLGILGAPCATVISGPEAKSPFGVVWNGTLTISWSQEGL